MKRKKIIIGISGGIAAVKIPELIKKLRSFNTEIDVILTRSAAKITTNDTYQKLVGVKNVFTSLFPSTFDPDIVLKKRKVEHIELAQTSNLIIIAPATGNIIAKIANGIADDYLTTVVLAATCPIVLCPSMNVYMWWNPITQQNIQKLKDRGMRIIYPDSGMLACGYEGQGRLANLDVIVSEINHYFQQTAQLTGKTVLVTAGGTREPIDDIRYLTNRSSGKMGIALADACYQRGARVILLRAKSSVSPRYNVEQYEFTSANELENLLKRQIMKANICFHTAAVSDYYIHNQQGKIDSTKHYALLLTPRPKILNKLKQWNPRVFVIGFKAESRLRNAALIREATKKARDSKTDIIVGNHTHRPSQGFEVDTNEVFVVTRDGLLAHMPVAPKAIIANQILDSIIPLLPKST